MRGSKIDDDIKELAIALLSTNQSMTKISQKLKIPLSTLSTWKKEVENDTEFVEVRRKNKERFVTDAWGVIGDSLSLIARRVKRALEEEDEIDKLKDAVIAGAPNGDNKSIYARFNSLKIENISSLSSIVGVLYDKQALINNEPTNKVELTLEDYLKKCEAKNEY